MIAGSANPDAETKTPCAARRKKDARAMQTELVWTHLLRQPLHPHQEERTVEVDHAVDSFDNALALIAVQVEGLADA